MSDVLLLGYVGIGALVVCTISGLWLTGEALCSVRISPWVCYTHLSSTLLKLRVATGSIVQPHGLFPTFQTCRIVLAPFGLRRRTGAEVATCQKVHA